MFCFALALSLLAILCTGCCSAYESRVFSVGKEGSKETSEFVSLHKTWMECTEFVSCYDVDEFLDKHKPLYGFPPGWTDRSPPSGQKFFTASDVLKLLKNDPHKELLILEFRTKKPGQAKFPNPESLRMLEERLAKLEPLIAELNYKRVIVVAIVWLPGSYPTKESPFFTGQHSMLVLKDTQEGLGKSPSH